MAWNPSPQVAVARDFGKKFGADRVVIFYALPDGRVGYASYGETKALCDTAGEVADAVLDEISWEFEVRRGVPHGAGGKNV